MTYARLVFVVFGVLGLGCGAVPSPRIDADSPPSTSAPRQTIHRLTGPQPWAEVGGSNHVILTAGDFLTDKTETTWYGPNGIKPTVGSYHLFPGVGRGQLHAMRLAGQKKVALVLWNMHFGSLGSDVYGHVVRSDLARLTPQHEANFRAWLADVESEGFDEVQLRFATQGPSDPNAWPAWNEMLYQETWNFIVNTRAVMESVLSPGIRRVYDLGGELGGLIESGQNRAYTKRLWTDWVTSFGTANTVGFSFATYPGRLQKMISVYDEVGVRPVQWAFDTYDNVEPWMAAVAQEFAAAGVVDPSLFVQETYADDEATAQAWANVAATTGLRLRTLMQWPVKPGAGPHFSMHFSESYAAYLPSSVPPTVSNAGVGCEDNFCIWITGANFAADCSVQISDREGAVLSRMSDIYRSADGTLVTLRLATEALQTALSTTGVEVRVFNGATASNGVFVVRQ
jgi:hypothetical protein